MSASHIKRIVRPALFICDVQERFRSAIYQFPAVVATSQKMLKAAEILKIPVYVTTQNQRALGATCSELPIQDAVVVADKTAFSMCVPDVTTKLPAESTVMIVGIESHICVLQTTLDLLDAGHKVYIIRDGVSSCNALEIPTALSRLQKAGAVITTSESWLFETMGDAGCPEFKAISGLVKETKASTRQNLELLCGGGSANEQAMSKI